MEELKPCPYEIACTCDLSESCGGCETYAKYLAGETHPRDMRNTIKEKE